MDENARIRAEYASREASIPADFYSWYREEIQYWQASTARVCARLLREAEVIPLEQKTVADIGCGTGLWLLEFLQWGAAAKNLHGIDLLERRVEAARQRLPEADLHAGDARRLPWPDGSMDLVTQFTMFSSIGDGSARAAVAAEMLRVVRRGGHLLWYDCRYSNPLRPAVHGLSRRDVRDLFPGCSIRFARATLMPPLSRAVARYSWAAAGAIESLGFTCTHLAALITPH